MDKRKSWSFRRSKVRVATGRPGLREAAADSSTDVVEPFGLETVSLVSEVASPAEVELQLATLAVPEIPTRPPEATGKKAGRGRNPLAGLIWLLDHHIHFLVLLFGLAYVLYSWFNLQSKYVQSQANEFEGTFNLSLGQTEMKFFRDAGSNRPVISSIFGDKLLEFSDWGSTITVNGVSRDLWATEHGYSLDAKNAKFYHSMRRDDWTLFQEITLGPEPNRALVEYYFRSNAAPADVTLELGHYRYHFTEPKLGNLGFEALIGGGRNNPEEDQDKNVRYKLAMQVNLAAFPGGSVPVKLTAGTRNKFGLTSVTTTYAFRNLPVNERTLVASEELLWENLPTPRP